MSLKSEGSAELGLSLNNALRFIELLEENQVPLFGAEVWRRVGIRYDLDVSTIWYSDTRYQEDYRSASDSLKRAGLAAEDLITVQFG